MRSARVRTDLNANFSVIFLATNLKITNTALIPITIRKKGSIEPLIAGDSTIKIREVTENLFRSKPTYTVYMQNESTKGAMIKEMDQVKKCGHVTVSV